MAALPATGQSQAMPSQPGPGPSPTSTTSEDLAASLRAAALRTLKSKRRKLETASETSAALPSHRPTEPTSIQLDYGQEELDGAPTSASSSTKPSAAPASKPVPPPAPSFLKPDQKEQDESQTREEGEISESEPTTPTAPVVKPEPATPQLRSAPQPMIKPQGKPPGFPKSPPIKTESTVIIVKPPQPPPSAASVASTSQLVPPRPPPFVINANHIRPGLEMTQAQYNAAKDIILDLLGWGVPPEFLVSCGVSREIVFYVFSELNLRLPSNLDLTGVVPMLPHGLPDMAQSVSTATQGQQSVPRTVPLESPASQALSASAPPFVPDASALRLPSSPDLLDMEQQRRQELLARKAVLASRKAKQQAVSASPTTSSPVATPATPAAIERKDVEMASAVPTTTVDDFLKSIEPVSEPDKGKGKASTAAPAPPSRTSTFDEMDVDEPIPGLSGAYASLPSPARSSSMSLVISASLTIPPSPTAKAIVRGPIVESPSSSGQSSLNGNSPIHPDDRDNVDAVPGLLSEQLRSYTFDAAIAARRGVKRPVAADFVDMEPGPSRPHSSNSYESFNTPYLHSSQRRRIGGSFAGVSGMRRCVINLSDSEDDEMEEDVVNIVLTNGQYEPGDVSMSSAQAASIPVTRPPSRRGTSQIPHGTARRVSPAAAPATLQEKEEEIRKMKELIARRERERLRKVASVS
ncbi:uncharacterized protein LAESUDRAFT_756996 [Laetiporus sulphureus 93-53]|uniref:Uncharacterized protein n=1 Tax=Laetiporus sulphureus 93-53 TaxID=1314785 RepID=A0A165FTA6_9APHY|nr:uncharacterized protein LAESUDRAFT_756996 [Laetiporus sulphureus 93-53]KZT09380.1 hypothetical protein LAESUDRAFT_756996 [Laetiporus sulphureus 93-53]